MRDDESGDEVDNHHDGGVARGETYNEEYAADELRVSREKRREERYRYAAHLKKLGELFHTPVAEDVILRAVNEVKADDEPYEDNSILFVFLKE